MSDLPVLELTFRDVAGSPWEGRAMVRLSGEEFGPFAVREGMTSKQRDDVRWYVEQFMDYPEGGHEKRAKQIEQRLEQYGLALWDGLQQQAPQLHQWLGSVQQTGGGRLELRAQTPQDEVAFRSPWELMRVGRGQLLHQLGVTIVRRGNLNLAGQSPADTSQGLRVLAVVSRPDEEGFLDPRYTPEAILEALADRPEVSVDFCRPATLKALVAALEQAKDDERPYHVVHFDGHGTTIPHEAGIGALCFEQDDGRLDLVRADQFGDLMSRYRIPLVVLEACRTATKTFARETVAGALLRHGVGSVLAMGMAVHVDMTRELMAGFYESLGRGQPIGNASQAARNAVYAQKHRRTRIAADAPTIELQDWFVPQLYQGGADPPLLTKKKRSRKKKRDEPLFAGFPSAPRAGFQGRGRELHKLERLLTRERAVVVHAPGGMGKTAISREAARWWLRTGLFPLGAVFVSLEGNPSLGRVIVQVGEALEGVDFLKRDDADRRRWLAEELGKRRLLIVWDNFESVLPHFTVTRSVSEEDTAEGGWGRAERAPSGDASEKAGGSKTRPQPPGRATGETFAALAAEWTSGSTRLLVTCRDSQPRLDSGSLTCRPFALGELDVTEGLMLMIGFLDRLGFDRTAREEHGWTVDALEPIVVKTCGHPLALELLAPHVVRLGAEAVARELPDVLAGAEQQHNEARNRSIQQSLDFSIRHLSAEARAALPAVALLSGGCLENMAVDIVGLEEEPWKAVRSELERTGLVRIEGPFLRPHPVLDSRLSLRESSADAVSALATGPENQPNPAEPAARAEPLTEGGPKADATFAERKATIDRFLDVVTSFCGEFNELVRTPQARMALGVMAGSEVVVPRAIDLAAATGRVEQVVQMANGLRFFLERSGRGGEGAALMTGLQESLIAPRSKRSDRGAINDYDAKLARQSAWARAREDAAGAAAELNRLLDELAAVTAWDTRFERAQALRHLGMIRDNFEHHPAEAIAPLEQAAALFAELEVGHVSNLPADSDQAAGWKPVPRIGSANRAATLGDLANALRSLGRFDEALDAAQHAWEIMRHRGQSATGLNQIAEILQQQGRYDQAETRYREELSAAQDAGDDEAAGITWQWLGNMDLDRKRPDEAASALRQALDAFARAGDAQGQMQVQVLNSLGNVEHDRGNAEAALAWYERSLELARQRDDVQGQRSARGNRAILLSAQAEAATDLAAQQRLLHQIISEEREILDLNEQMGHPADIAIGHNNLANNLRLAGQLDEAEQHARTALAIRQQLNDPRLPSTLQILEDIAEARGDATAAAEYRAAKEAARAEAQERAGGGGLPRETIVGLLQLALTARHHKLSLTDALRSAGADDNLLAAIQQTAPWLAAHLEALAAGHDRPATEVPAAHQPLIDEVWQAASS